MTAQQGLGLLHAAGNAGDATGGGDVLEECRLLTGRSAGRGLDLNGSKHRQRGAHHVWGDGDGAVADQVG